MIFHRFLYVYQRVQTYIAHLQTLIIWSTSPRRFQGAHWVTYSERNEKKISSNRHESGFNHLSSPKLLSFQTWDSRSFTFPTSFTIFQRVFLRSQRPPVALAIRWPPWPRCRAPERIFGRVRWIPREVFLSQFVCDMFYKSIYIYSII